MMKDFFAPASNWSLKLNYFQIFPKAFQLKFLFIPLELWWKKAVKKAEKTLEHSWK